jgi:tRNA threonylcarbamoyl adenosine modification protein YjeE
MTTSVELVTESSEATEAAGERLSVHLRRGDLLRLEGPLGAGKTTFVRGLVRGLGSSGHVMSPTFQLVRVYPGRLPLAHADLYRLERAAELGELGFDELLDEGVLVVEWGDRLAGEVDGGRVVFEPIDERRRRLRLEGGRPGWTW